MRYDLRLRETSLETITRALDNAFLSARKSCRIPTEDNFAALRAIEKAREDFRSAVRGALPVS